MSVIRYVEESDREDWFKLDKHLSESEFERKVRDKQGFVMRDDDGALMAILRYNLFWDSIPFCTLLFVDGNYRSKGCGRAIIGLWEKYMSRDGYGMVMTSTQVDEEAQHFYRKLGYTDSGGLIINIPGYEQPMEMFMVKKL